MSITQIAEITAIIKPSRSLFVPHPFGLTFGTVNDAATQRAVLAALLDTAATMPAAGMLDSGFTWEWDDLRTRQLRKQRH
ncbi:MAG TPA: hypothetical protein VGR22_09110 [Thermomicrobiales bacterium]|nr:hypothetical protein [Thermomicrobiales bacterium]